MAKTKGKKITLEEALVPVDEQPYQVPGNWCWTYLKSGFEVTSSKRVHKSDWINSGIPFYRTRELVKLSANGEVDNELFISEKLYDDLVRAYGKPNIGDILISGVGTIGVPYVISSNEKFYFKDGNVIWLKNKKLFNSKYVYYMYKSLFMYNQIHDMSAGTTVDTYTIVNANMTKIPLPPLAEQQRIVEQIENLFSKLDEAKEKAQTVVDSFEFRKSAILHKAFTGNLIGKDNVALVQLESIVDEIRIGPFGSALHEEDYIVDGVPVINPKHIANQMIIPQSKVTVSAEKVLELQTYRLKINDIVLGRRGEMGRVAPVTGKEEGWLCGTGSIIIRLKKEYQAKFYSLIISSQASVQYLESHAVGTTLKNLNEKIVRQLPIPDFTIEEQNKLLYSLDSLLFKEQQAKEAAEAVLDQIDTMKKSILARAFRGELGTNNPKDGNAIELLKCILDEAKDN